MILLDTHVALWLALDPGKISGPAASAIEFAQEESLGLALSIVSLYEVARIVHRGRVQFDGSAEELLDGLRTRFSIADLTPSIVLTAAQLPASFPGDPMDRLIASTGISRGIPLVTADQHIRRSRAVKTIW